MKVKNIVAHFSKISMRTGMTIDKRREKIRHPVVILATLYVNRYQKPPIAEGLRKFASVFLLVNSLSAITYSASRQLYVLSSNSSALLTEFGKYEYKQYFCQERE